MAGSTTKQVQIWRFDREVLPGFVNPATYLTDTGVELLTRSGTVTLIKYADIKAVLFVKDFGSIDGGGIRRVFLSRPKLDGLWLRLVYRDGDTQEAVMPNNLLHVEPLGFNLIPPETTQRLWVPREAVTSVQVLGVVGLKAAAKRTKAVPREQARLFDS
jgi:AICAR transformylase/IMP cyclohydrolase PurH